MLHRLSIAFGLVFLATTPATAGDPTPQSNVWRKIGFGHGSGYHAYNACPPCAMAPTPRGRGGINYYGGYYVPGAYPGPQAGWFSHHEGPQTWSDSMVHGGPLSPMGAAGETIILTDDPVSAEAAAEEQIDTPKPGSVAPAPSPMPSKLPAAPKAKQPPVQPAPAGGDDEPAPKAKTPQGAATQLQELQAEEPTAGVFQESNLPVKVEGDFDPGLNDEPAGALLPE